MVRAAGTRDHHGSGSLDSLDTMYVDIHIRTYYI